MSSTGLPAGVLKINGDRINPATEETLAAILAATGSGSAGTEYTEGDTDASITGPAIMWEDTGNTLRAVSAAKPLPVEIIISALPSGAATAANQSTIIGHVDDIEALLTTIDGRVDGVEGLLTTLAGAVTSAKVQVDVITSALPSGAATAANQATIIGHVDGIETLLTTIDGRVDGIEGLLGTTNSTLSTIDGRVDGIEGLLTTIDGHVDGVEALLTTIDADTSVLSGAVDTGRVLVNLIASQAGVDGNSGTVSAKTQRVVLATDVGLPAGTNLLGKVGRDTQATGSLANVASSASNVTLLSSNSSRKGAIIYNDSLQPLKIKFGATASATSFTTEIPPGWEWEMTGAIYTGIIDGIWDAANGSARVTEL